MRFRRMAVGALLTFALAAGWIGASAAENPLPVSSSSPSVTRGQYAEFVLSGTAPGAAVALFSERCAGGKAAGCEDAVLRTIACVLNNSACRALVPLDLPLGDYEVRVYPNDQVPDPSRISGAPSSIITVARETSAAPLLLGVIPEVTYPGSGSERCLPGAAAGRGNQGAVDTVSLALSGANFSLAGKDNRILIDGNEMSVCWTCGARDNRGGCPIAGSVSRGGRLIRLDGIPIDQYAGSHEVAVEVDGVRSDPMTFVISRVGRNAPAIAAVVMMAAVAAILVLVLSGKASGEIAGSRYRRITALMMDPDTYTYSLSKFQFYLWTLAAVLGYSYLTIARTLVQGKFEFAPVPAGLPGILFVSAGTTVVAAGVTRANGTKGAGGIQPSFSDLLTIGGVVAPERVQFVVWTLLGVFTFLALTLYSDPGSIRDLPAIPQEFLYLMGISSAGYLGGKLVRKPGPVITAASALWEEPDKLTVEVIGTQMSVQPGIRIDSTHIVYALPSQELKTTDSILEVTGYDPIAADKSLAASLRLTIRDPNLIAKVAAMQKPPPQAPKAVAKSGQALTGPASPAPPPSGAPSAPATDVTEKPTISITNPDGQSAQWPFVIG
jgi:predicted RNA-binding protein YlqC (UPF0109 family)